MSLAVNQLIGFGSRSGSTYPFSDVHLPAGVTAVFRAGWSVDENTFDTNTVSAAKVGSPTWNASGGAGGGAYLSGVSMSYYYSTSNIHVGNATPSNWITAMCWIKTSDAGSGVAYGPRVNLFGDGSVTVSWQAGISGGKLHIASGSSTPQGVIGVADNAWHLVAYQQTDQGEWTLWVDGAKDASGISISSGNWSNSYIKRIGSGYAYGGVGAGNLDGVQILQGNILDVQIEEIYARAGF